MKKISKSAAIALLSGKRYVNRNTVVYNSIQLKDGTKKYAMNLSKNTIAEATFTSDGTLKGVTFSAAGWNTTTTRDRLNAIFDTMNVSIRVCQKNFDFYIWNTKTGVKSEASTIKWYDTEGNPIPSIL